MMTSRSKWDVTTAEGSIALERYLMKRIGYIDEDPKKPWEGWFVVQTLDEYREYLPDHVEPGWVFTPEGMVALKRWAAEKYGLRLESWVDRDGLGKCEVHRPTGEYKGIVFMASAGVESGHDEPTAVALALALALEEMEAQGGGDGA